MNLLITYLVTVTIGIITAAWVGVFVDKMSSPFISLLVFFPMFALIIWLAWRFAVKFTAPKPTTRA